MRIAFVSVPRFPCAVEVQRAPHLARRPLIVGDAEQPKRVLDCSFEAAEAGVCHEMTIRTALGLCPDAVILPPDPVLYRGKWEAVLLALGEVTPEVEDEGLGRAYLNVNGLQKHYRDESALGQHVVETVRGVSGLDASVGIALGKLPALAAARMAQPDGTRVIVSGGEAGFLAPLPVHLLPLEPDDILRLQMLGLDEIGDVARLSLPELQSQFGFAGRRLWQLANGIDDEPLRPRPPQERVEAGLSFEAPVAGIDVLVAVGKQLLSRLLLPLRGRAARELTLQAELTSGRGWEQRLVFREAVSETDRLLFLMRSALTNFPPPNAVNSLSLCLGGLTGETGKQLYLGEKQYLQRQLEEVIQQLKARYGYSPVYRCVDVESWSVVPEERQILVESDG
jgi:nucleotidyltransferase/DNA polymerase involved in DNA repair